MYRNKFVFIDYQIPLKIFLYKFWFIYSRIIRGIWNLGPCDLQNSNDVTLEKLKQFRRLNMKKISITNIE